MKKSGLILALSTAVLLLLTGCVSERPSDISLDELEKRVAQAMDPAGKYRNAYAYFQRQNILEKGFWNDKHQLVELRFQRPDKFKFSYFEKNAPVTEILSYGGRAWTVDHKNGIVKEIQGESLEKFKVMLELGHPDTDYDRIFAKVDLSMVSLEGKDYYKLVCHPRVPGANPITIYIDNKEYLPRRMELTLKHPDGDVDSVSTIEEYFDFGGVKLPMLTKVEEGEREFTTRIVGYQLDAHFSQDEFKKPHFDPVLLEMKKQRDRRR